MLQKDVTVRLHIPGRGVELSGRYPPVAEGIDRRRES